MLSADTIAACLTPWGHSAIAVVRVSGPESRAAVQRVCGVVPAPRRATRARFRDGEGVFDDGLVTFFPAPHSYTGEDVVELSGHGNPLLVERLLRALGARIARPGEFTRRAFLNGRVDLIRAEAVLATIEATSSGGLRMARAWMDGAEAVPAGLVAEATAVAAELEAALDYPGEDLTFASDAELSGRLAELAALCRSRASTWPGGRVAVTGARVVLAGPVNAGKSSLFNALLGRSRAIVSPLAGTTRDAVESVLQLDAVRITLVDTAGERVTADPIEAQGVAHTAREVAEADLTLRCWPADAAVPPPALGPGELLVRTRADLAPAVEGLAVSSATGAGLAELRVAMLHSLGVQEGQGGAAVLLSARQAECFESAAQHFAAASAGLAEAGPAVAVEGVYAALERLDPLMGGGVREAVLDELFARFCIGK